MDVESLQKSDRRRGGCLDVFLVVSVMFLFAAVTALAVFGVTAVTDLRSNLHLPSMTGEFHQLKSTEEPSNTLYTNFAYVEATSSQLENTTMRWAAVLQGEGSSIGRNFLFDPDQQSLMPSKAGTYFIYINLNLTCTNVCSAGLLTVYVGDKITCNVQLPELADTTPVYGQCWTVSRIASEKLVAVMTVPKEGLNNWKLELSGSGYGMFLVD